MTTETWGKTDSGRVMNVWNFIFFFLHIFIQTPQNDKANTIEIPFDDEVTAFLSSTENLC